MTPPFTIKKVIKHLDRIRLFIGLYVPPSVQIELDKFPHKKYKIDDNKEISTYSIFNKEVQLIKLKRTSDSPYYYYFEIHDPSPTLQKYFSSNIFTGLSLSQIELAYDFYLDQNLEEFKDFLTDGLCVKSLKKGGASTYKNKDDGSETSYFAKEITKNNKTIASIHSGPKGIRIYTKESGDRKKKKFVRYEIQMNRNFIKDQRIKFPLKINDLHKLAFSKIILYRTPLDVHNLLQTLNKYDLKHLGYEKSNPRHIFRKGIIWRTNNYFIQKYFLSHIRNKFIITEQLKKFRNKMDKKIKIRVDHFFLRDTEKLNYIRGLIEGKGN